MNFAEKLARIEQKNNSRLCVGLDTDVSRIPAHLRTLPNALLKFNMAIIEATADLVSAYKINFAFYEQYGEEGISALKGTLDGIPHDIITIADAKRGDIGNTSAAYASACFENWNFDAITVAPYMGRDSVQPFLRYPDKMTFVLALTSNEGSADFQRLVADGKPMYRHVMEKSLSWTDNNNVGFVVGATHPAELEELRELAPSAPFLIPGIGTQGGEIGEVLRANGAAPAIINVSRAIIYADSSENFADGVREKALEYQRLLALR